jgi:hypothetical protein
MATLRRSHMPAGPVSGMDVPSGIGVTPGAPGLSLGFVVWSSTGVIGCCPRPTFVKAAVHSVRLCPQVTLAYPHLGLDKSRLEKGRFPLGRAGAWPGRAGVSCQVDGFAGLGVVRRCLAGPASWLGLLRPNPRELFRSAASCQGRFASASPIPLRSTLDKPPPTEKLGQDRGGAGKDWALPHCAASFGSVVFGSVRTVVGVVGAVARPSCAAGRRWVVGRPGGPSLFVAVCGVVWVGVLDG